MKNYDIVVIGTGCGSIISSEAAEHEQRVAIIDKGPSSRRDMSQSGLYSFKKMLIHTADQIVDIQQSGKLGIKAEIQNIDFLSIMERMRLSRKKARSIFERNLLPKKISISMREEPGLSKITL